MPAIKSSSRSGNELKLFADEKRALIKARDVCDWISENWSAGTLASDDGKKDFAKDAADAIGSLLALLIEQERSRRV